MHARKQIKTVVEFALDEHQAEILCADLLWLLEISKDAEAVVATDYAPMAFESKSRIGAFQKELQRVLNHG